MTSSLLAAAYVWRFVEAAYFREPRAGTGAARAVPWSMGLPTALLGWGEYGQPQRRAAL